MKQTIRSRAFTAGAVLALTCTLGACAKSEDQTSGSSGNSAAAAQQVAGQNGGDCALKQYGAKKGELIGPRWGSPRAKKGDLKGATVGFSQSEKEANPFRIAETQSMKDEAAKQKVKLETTNANS